MRGISGKSDNGDIAARIVFEASSGRRTNNTPTGKFIKAIHDQLDRSSFDASEFGYLFSMAPAGIQRAFIKVIVKYMYVLAQRAENALWMDEEERLVFQDGKVIYDAISFLDD